VAALREEDPSAAVVAGEALVANPTTSSEAMRTRMRSSRLVSSVHDCRPVGARAAPARGITASPNSTARPRAIGASATNPASS
jgi:hypothetical protein